MAMLKIALSYPSLYDHYVRRQQAGMILQIHDEFIFEVPDEKLKSRKKLFVGLWKRLFSLKVPLIVDVMVGKNWKRMSE